MAPIVKSLPLHIIDKQHALEIFHEFQFLRPKKNVYSPWTKSLYTIIPNDEGFLAVKHFFDQRAVKEPSSETLHRLAELLSLSCFTFGDIFMNKPTV